MLTLYPERENNKQISWANHRFLSAGFVALAMMVLPWHPDRGRHFLHTKLGELPIHEKTLSDGVIRGNDAFSHVLAHLRSYRPVIRNTRYLTIIDYSQPSYMKRMSLIDMETGRVEKFLVSHGKHSGWVYATMFSNQPESFQSCRGFFVTGKEYSGKHGIALQLHGLETGVNDNAFRRGIVIHGSNYVSMRSVMLNRGRLGRSLGCPAIPAERAESIINRIKDGSLVYIYTGG